MMETFAGDSPPFGMESPPHRLMMATMCCEQYAQQLVERPANPADLLAGFAAIAAAG